MVTSLLVLHLVTKRLQKNMLVFTSPKPTEGKLDADYSIQSLCIESNQKVGYVTPAKPNTNSSNHVTNH